MKYEFYWAVLWQYRALLLEGLRITLFLFAVGTILSVVLGTIFGTLGVSRFRLLRVLGEVYVEVNRNTPLVVKLFFLYFGFGLEAYPAAIIGLAAHQSAYMAEIVRSGIESVTVGQMEAALSSGLTRIQAMRRIILPQGLIIVIPPLTTQVLETLKNTSIAMTITIPELTFQTQQIEAYSFRGFEAATAATLMYLAIGVVVASFSIGLEWWLVKRRTRVWSVTRPIAPMTAAT
jgi:polar amino acid transport system permease protein